MKTEELAAKVFKALGHPIRYKIVKFLMDEPKCVCKLNENVEFSQANLSQHLKILKDAGILKSEKDGLKIIYSISCDEIRELIKDMDKFIISYVKNMKDDIL
jgi:DNA-binding transcriptional ArsR family regulator